MAIGDKLKEMVPTGGIASWVRWAISDRKVVYLVVLVLVVLGMIGITRMNKDEYPTFELTQGLVVGIYPGATAAEVERQLTKPLEEQLFSYKEVKRQATHSVSRAGMSFVYVDLNCPQSRKDEVWSKLRLGLQQFKPTLPQGVLAVAVLDDYSNVTSLLIALESNDKSHFELQDYAEDLSERLREIPDLARVAILGRQQEEIAVTLDPDRLSAYKLNPAALLWQYQTSALSLPAGTFDTDYTSTPIHVNSTISGEREVYDRIIFSDPSGSVVRLKDVAKVERRYRKPTEFVSYNGNSCLVLDVSMTGGYDIVAFGREVEGVLASFEQTLPESVHLSRITDQPKVVRGSVWGFLRDLMISMLVVIFVMLMLFPIRSALIAGSGVPICTAIAMAIMYFTGIPLNTVTLAALIVVLGMIVDDSIITMDGYMDKLGRGLRGVDAACASAHELFLPTFVATLAISLMFFPILGIITGYLGNFVQSFPWVIFTALMVSLFYAVSVVPSLEVRYIRQGDPSRRKNIADRVQDAFFRAIQKVYDACEEWCFGHPAVTIAGGVAAVALGLLIFSRLNVQMMPMAARDHFVVEMYLEGGKGIDDTKARADSLTVMFLKDDRIKSVTTFAGTSAPRFNATYAPILPSPRAAQLIVNTTSKKATESVLKEYGDRCEFIFPDTQLRFKQMDYQAVEAPLVVQLAGNDRDSLALVADKIKSFMLGMGDQLQWVHSDADQIMPSLEVSLDPDESARLGVNKAMVSLSLAGSYGTQPLATLWEGDRKIPVNLYTEESDANEPYSNIGNRMVATSVPTVDVPLRQVASIFPGWDCEHLCRTGGKNFVAISADMKYGQSQPAAEKKIKNFVKSAVVLPQGVELSYTGLSATNKYVLPEIMWSFLAAVAVLFIFLLVHFKKTSIAVLTMMMSPLCLFGAFLGLWLFGLDFSITAVLGLISLVGIIVRNGILMFEYAEEARFERGDDVRSAALEAGKRRMRPILLTSLTTALGVLPMILDGDMLWLPMGVVICFGTIMSVFLITIIMPVSYWLVFRGADGKEAVR